jgi:plastocyanin
MLDRVRSGPRHAAPRALLLVVLALAVAAPAAGAAPAASAVPGVQHLKFRFGPIHIAPGQNTIKIQPNEERPKVPGYILSFKPNLRRADGTVPRVDVVHLHHGVWVVNFRPIFAAGEEKTTVRYPRGFGYRYSPKDSWLMNYMIHNLTPNPETVTITYDVDFLPASAPAAKAITEVDTQWLDVQGGSIYPVFDAMKGTGGKDGRLTYPREVPDAYAGGRARNRWVADRDATLVQTAGHLHPGGLYTDLTVTRDGRTVRLFRSRAKYYEPAGAVSWDVSMGVTPPDWRVAIKKGDVLAVSGTYDTRRASWYESMAIMPVAVTKRPAGGLDPFVRAPKDGRSVLTHGHLPENDNHGGGQVGLPDMTKTIDGPVAPTQVTIDGFVYNQGDMGLTGVKGRPPVIAQGQTLRFFNRDAKRPGGEPMHTITACRAPCNRATGVAYPLADAAIQFDSGNLGYGQRGFTAASNRDSWETPASLPQGTYTYFCRIHPFMRGAFRVKGAKGS